MIFGNVNGIKTLAQKGLNGTCDFCGEILIPKCGNVKTWHWAHKSKVNCDDWHKGETDWHLQWKERFNKLQMDNIVIEKTIIRDDKKHRADVCINDTVIEIQNSYLSPDKIKEREDFYQNMFWIFNGDDYELFVKQFCNTYAKKCTSELHERGKIWKYHGINYARCINCNCVMREGYFNAKIFSNCDKIFENYYMLGKRAHIINSCSKPVFIDVSGEIAYIDKNNKVCKTYPYDIFFKLIRKKYAICD